MKKPIKRKKPSRHFEQVNAVKKLFWKISSNSQEKRMRWRHLSCRSRLNSKKLHHRFFPLSFMKFCGTVIWYKIRGGQLLLERAKIRNFFGNALWLNQPETNFGIMVKHFMASWIKRISQGWVILLVLGDRNYYTIVQIGDLRHLSNWFQHKE